MKKFTVAVALLSLCSATPVKASGSLCYNLWEQRNDYYARYGYCFKTQLAIDRFGNEECRFNNMRDVPLSYNDRQDIDQIVKRENKLRCHL